MRLYFVRHGQSEANVQSVISNRDLPHPLTELGRQQAMQLAQAMAAVPVTRIYSSPLLRARQTAEILSAALGAPIEITDALREFDCGIAEGRSDDEAWSLSRRVMDDWLGRGDPSSRIEGGEYQGHRRHGCVDRGSSLRPWGHGITGDTGRCSSQLWRIVRE